MGNKLQFEKDKQKSQNEKSKHKSDTTFEQTLSRFSTGPSYSFGVAATNSTINEIGYKPWNSCNYLIVINFILINFYKYFSLFSEKTDQSSHKITAKKCQ